jgi:hypothetical protein
MSKIIQNEYKILFPSAKLGKNKKYIFSSNKKMNFIIIN